MKHTFRFVLTLLIAFSVFSFAPKQAHAWVDTPYTIPYTVSTVVGQGPSVYAGPDANWTLPISSATLSGTATDPDGTIVTTVWTFTSGPITPTIASPSSLSTGVSGMTTAGTYVFTLSAQDNDGNWASDQMQIVISTSVPVGPSGTLSAGSCGIATGASTCTSTVGWTTSDLTVAATTITRDVGSPSFFSPSPLASGSQSVTLNYGTTTFSLIHNSATLAQAAASASCLSVLATWNGSICTEGSPTPINGICAATHWSCLSGTSANQAGTGPWTWSCLGSNGGSNDSCSETGGGGGGGKPECSDGVDNADTEDALADTLDPGCHSDGNASNPFSYDPNDTSETNKRKPIFIEF